MQECKIFWDNLEDQGFVVNQINGGEFIGLLESSFCHSQVLKGIVVTEDIKNSWTSCVANYAAICTTPEMETELIAVGVAALLLFIQKNWTGPDVDIPKLPGINYEDLNIFNKQQNLILKELIKDGENVNPVVEHPELLYLAVVILSNAYVQFPKSNIAKIWYMRSLFIQQQILEESSPALYTEIMHVIDEIKTSDSQSVEFNLEVARIYLYYDYVQKSKVEIENAMKRSGIQTSLIGALGKRTKFQQTDLAQLTLKVDIKENEGVKEKIEENCPVDVNLEDEVRLNKIKYAHDNSVQHPDLTGLQQAVILGFLFQTQKSQPKDKLADEELQSIISCLLDKPKTWSIQLSSLLFRSKLEANNKRTVERTMMQMQALSDCIGNSSPSVKNRLRYFFISYEPPKWVIESTFANVLVSLGSIKSALDIYERLQEWENVINCYNALQLRHKAQEIIEQELKKNETPKLWCLLGDATDDTTYYRKAWELSNEKSARAQKHWAYFLYGRREYNESIGHFQKSLEINSLQSELWYRLGYAALHEEKWEISAQAYRRYCVLDPECFEAWNNLARCYCELKQKQRAWTALREALKIDYSNWRVWDNYMIVSSDLQEFDEVIRSYHQVLNLKEKHLDIPVLKSLVYGLLTLAENNEKPSEENFDKDVEKLRDKLLTLFGRITSQILNDPELWYLYSEIPQNDTEEGQIKKHQLLLKAHRSAVNKPGWEKDLESCKKIVRVLTSLIDVSLKLKQRNYLTSCKLAASGTVIRIKKEYPENETCSLVEEKLSALNEALDTQRMLCSD